MAAQERLAESLCWHGWARRRRLSEALVCLKTFGWRVEDYELRTSTTAEYSS
jgi:hypothetical protein